MTDEIDDVLGPSVHQDPLPEVNAIWLPVCPLRLPQRARECLGFREREPGRLQLRVPMLHNEGVCTVVLDQHPSHVVVRVVVCWRDDDDDQRYWYPGFAEERTHAYLDAPLGDRSVIDFETGKLVPFYVPTWLDGHRTKAPGFTPSARRQLLAPNFYLAARTTVRWWCATRWPAAGRSAGDLTLAILRRIAEASPSI